MLQKIIPHFPKQSRRRRGSLYPIVMGVTAIITCLAVAGLEMSRVAGKANKQLRDQIEARRMAQAGLDYWQRQYNAQALQDPTATLNVKLDSRSGFTVSATLSPLGVSTNGAAQVTSTGTYGSATQRLTARYEARPTLYEGFRSALYSNDGSINHTSSTVNANHWSIARQDTSASSSSIFMDAMTGNAFTGTMSNFQQRRVASIPWNMQVASFDPNHAAYPGAAYRNATGAVTIQPPQGGDQLLVNGDFNTAVTPWYTNSTATLTRDTTLGYNSTTSCRMTNRVSGNDSPVQEISRFLVKGNRLDITAFVRPSSNASFQLFVSYTFSNPSSRTTFTTSGKLINANQWTNINLSHICPTMSRPADKVELGIASDTNTSFHFDSVTMYNSSRNSGIAYIQNTVLSHMFNPFSQGNSSPSAAGIYVVDCRGGQARIENARIRSTLVFTNCTGVDLRGGIVWEVPNPNYPAIIASTRVTDNTVFSSVGTNVLSESEQSFNVNPSHTPASGISDMDFSDSYTCSIQGPVFSTDSVSLGNSTTSMGKIRSLTGPILAKNTVTVQNTTKDINFDSNMILNPPPGFYPAFTPMRLIPSSIDEVSAPASGGGGQQTGGGGIKVILIEPSSPTVDGTSAL